jgi:CO dehydrogenase nickel-insertion accessory protein CooC1
VTATVITVVDSSAAAVARAERIAELRRERDRVAAELRDFTWSGDRAKDYAMKGVLIRELAVLDLRIAKLEARNR